MIDHEETLGVILARAGSVGLPGKSMRMLLDRHVIEYTFDHAQAAQRITRLVVSSNDDAVLALSRRNRIEVIERPAELATSSAATDPALRHAVRHLHQVQRYWPRFVVMLYGNVPVRNGGMIDGCVAMLQETNCDSVQTVAPVGKMHPYWMFDRETDGQIKKHVANAVFRRQDLPALYYPTGSVYAMRTDVLMAAEGNADPHAFLGEDRRGLVINPEDTVDIDSAKDLFLAEAILRWEREAC